MNQQVAQESLEKLFKIHISESTDYDMSSSYDAEKLGYSDPDQTVNWDEMVRKAQQMMQQKQQLKL